MSPSERSRFPIASEVKQLGPTAAFGRGAHVVRAAGVALLLMLLPAQAQSDAAARLAVAMQEMRSPDKEVRLKAVGKLVHFAGGQELAAPALPSLRAAMNDPEAEVRAVACTATGNLRGQAKAAVPDLVRLLCDSDKEVRQCAARALGRVGSDAKPALTDMARSTKDEDPVVRVVTHAAMIRLGEPVGEHLPPVLKGLEDPSPLVRYKSAHCLEPLGAVAAPGVAKLGALLTDPDEKVRHYSARALVNLGETARPALAALKAARAKETTRDNQGLMDAAIRKLGN